MDPGPAAFVDVALDLPVDRLFTYSVPEALRARAEIGRRVRVRFRGRTAVGFVAALRDRSELDRVLPLDDLPDEPALLTADLLQVAEFTARYYGASVSLPYFIPAPPPFPFGTLGAVIRMRSLVADRNALLDIAAAGPLAGLAIAVPALVLGLSWSTVGPAPDGLYIDVGNSVVTGLIRIA